LVVGVLVLFAAGTATVGVTHQLGWLASSDEAMVRVAGDGRTAARRAQSTNNLKHIALALHNYHNANHSFPPGATFDQLGRPMHSWQTLILPYIEFEGLPQQVHLDKRWNDPINRSVFQTVIPPYLNPGIHVLKNEAGYALSHYAANAVMLGGDQTRKLSDVSDGTSMTFIAGEVASDFKAWGDPTNWRDPQLGINRSPKGFGSVYPGGANFLFIDGSVKFIRNSVDLRVFKSLSTPSGQEKIDVNQY
jgi:prepilin-type processing-associated H-X9-DG protein